LQQGDTAKAQAIFAEVLRTKEAEGQKANKEAAEAARSLGALAFMNDTKAALAAYQKAVQLDPDNADGWNMLGHLLFRTGELAQAEEACRKVLVLGETKQDRRLQAIAYTTLGIVYATRGEVEQAEQMYKKSLEINETLGSKNGRASNYTNLGGVYLVRGEVEQAEQMYKKSLTIDEALDRKEGMAIQYGNLGRVYLTRGDMEQAEVFLKKSLYLFQEMKHPNANNVQRGLDQIARRKASTSR
jgi:tetratricopeptide (TPR) repeat protein